jgi:ComF family protein
MATTTSLARSLGRAALDLLFPPRCAVCGAGGAFLCDGCAASLVEASPPRCPRCWRPAPDADECLHCQLTAPPFDALRTAFVYQGVARELVHALKYRGMTVLAAPMASLLAGAAAQARFDLVVPVPLSGLRKRTRGYNQAELLARALAGDLGVPAQPSALVRRRHTAPQARSADAEARHRNVAGAFVCRDESLAGRRVLLIDDVTTTGATLAACAEALRTAGAASVWALAFARED